MQIDTTGPDHHQQWEDYCAMKDAEQDNETLPTGSTRRADGTLHGWTGRKCPECNGTGEVPTEHSHGACRGCGGTGEEYGPIPEPT
jgi:DnaJ-class molecular chaperone